MTIQIKIVKCGDGRLPLRRNVFMGSECLLTDSRDPEHDGARAMALLGLEGPFETLDERGHVSMRFSSIAWAATRTMAEGTKSELREVKWKADDRWAD